MTAAPAIDRADSDYEKVAATHVSLRRVLELFRPYRAKIAIVAFLMLLGACTGMSSPFLLRAIIDEALPSSDLHQLVALVVGLLFVAVLSTCLSTAQVILSVGIGQAIMHDLRVRVYSHLQSLSLGFFTATRAGEIQSRISSDISGLQSLVTTSANELARASATVIMTAAAIVLLEWRLALFVFLIVPGTVAISNRVAKMREKLLFEQQERIADMSSAIQETLSISGVILARTMNRGEHLSHRFSRLSGEVAKLEARAHTAGEWQWALINLALSVLPALTLLVGGLLMQAGAPISIGTLVAMIALQEQLLWPLEQLLEIGREMRTTRALFARIFAYLDRPVEITQRADTIALDRADMRGAVRVENVSFFYPGAATPALRDVSIDIPTGGHLAIVGATGSGKTTLGYLLARLYDVDAGVISFDGVDIRALRFETLADMLGVVTQEPYLLHATVAENLRFGRPEASDDQLARAARIAQIHEMIMALPDRYETLVGERGYRFSGGEKQRLALARVILRDPPILLLDEATSALDAKTEHAMACALATLSQGRTTITIAHRLSTVRQADQIIVLQKGQIVERGTHDELVSQGRTYSELVMRSHLDRQTA
nr:ABC transporter ATP-binding protein [Methylosinus sp. PW1]